MPNKEPSFGEASRSIPPLNRLAKPIQNSSGVSSTNTRLVGNYHQTPSHQLNTPYHSPLNPSNPVPLPSSAQVPSNLTNTTYSNPPARHPSYGDHYHFLPSNHPRHPKASTSSSTPSQTSSAVAQQNHQHHHLTSQQRLPPSETRKIVVGQKRKSSASPSPELHPENLNINQPTNTTNRRTSKAWGPPSPLPTGSHHLNHPRAYNPSSYHPPNQRNLHPSSTQACESRPSSLAGLLATHPDGPQPPTEPSKLDVPYPTATEVSMSRRDPDRSRGRPSITNPPTSQNTSQIQPPPVSTQRPSSAEQQWSSHHRSSVGCSPQISRHTMLNDPADPSTRSNYSKPSTPLTSNQALPDRTTTAYGHPFRSETHRPAASNDMQHSRSPTVYYHSYPTHRQPNHPHPQQHHHPLYPPPPLPHDHRPELHLRTNFSQQSIRHSSLSTPDGHLLPTQSPSRPDPDPKQHSHRLLHHQSPSHENHFLHPSQNRIHYSDASRPSPTTSNYPLPHPASRPSTSSSLTNQHPPMSTVSQQTRHSHHLESPSGSPDRPRLYQPEPRRVTLPSPDLQLQLSPRHQNTDLYPSQSSTERPCQQVPPHPLRSSHTNMLRSTHSTEDAHFSPPRQLERYPEQAHHSSVPGPPRHRSSMSTDLSHNPQPSRQSRPQPVYMHELSSEFPHRPPPSLQAESDSHRHDNPSMEFSTHQTSSHESDQSPQIRHSADHPATDRARYAQSPPQGFKVQHATYSGRDHLASPIVMQSHPSYSGPSPRQPLPTHYEHQHHPATQNESPFNQNLNSSVIRAEHPPEGRPTVGSLHGVSFAHQASRSQAPSNGFPSSHEHCLVSSQEAHHQKRRSVPSNNPRRNSRPTKVEKVDELPRAGTSQLWSRDAADTSHMDHVYAKVSNVSLSNKPECNREKTAKSSSQPELPISKGLTNIPPAPDLRLASQGGLSTDVKRPKLSHQNSRPSSPSKYSLPVHHKEKDTDNIISPAPSRPKAAHETTNADCDTSREPSSTDDAAVDDGVIRCICSITTDDGFTIQCETCEVWQHAVCVNVPIDEVPEHYFCDRCDPSPERRRRLVEMAPQAERIQRQRLQKEADARSQDQDENSIAPDSPCPSNHPGLDERDESLVGSPAASTAMSRVSSGARPNDSIHGEPPGQSPHSYVKGKNKASSSGHQERVQTIPYPDNGLGLSGLQESPTTISAARIDDLSLPRDAAPRKPGRKPTKFAQPKSQSSKQSLDPPLSCSVANNVMETDSNVLAQNGADNDDRYEAWRYEYTPTLKDLYLDAEVKCQVQQLIKHYTRLRTVCDNDAAIGSDTETPGQEVDKSVAPASSKSIPPPSMESCRSPAPVVDQLAQVSDIPVKPQRPIPHAFASTNFLPVTMSELPPPSKLTIKAIPPSAINFFPSLATNPFCPNFATSLNNSSTSSLPRLITHGVFSTQPIPRGSFIASIKGSITSVRKYTEDVYNQYASLGCNKPYVKFFKSTRLEDPFLRDQDLAQIDDGLVIDSRQYGNEMRYVRNGCHPNAFINIIMTPPAPRLHDSELPNKPDISQSRTPSTLTSSFPTPSLDRPNHPNNLWSTADCDRPSHWEVSFGIFAASDISRREEIILPWEWDDQHLVHLLPRLLSHSTAFEAQQQRSPTLPPARIRFLPWSMSDLRLLSCKLAAVTLTFFGLMVCGCERKRSCAINLMWKIGCLSAGQPMFPTEDGTADSEVCEMTSISNLKERQEMNLPLTFEEKLRIALNSFLEQPYHLPSKIGRSANPNVNTPSVGRPKKPKIDLGPLLGLKRDWWRYPAAYRSEAESSRTLKTMTKKQKRPRSRSVFNRKPSVHKIRRVSDVGELRQPGLTVANSINHTKASSPQAHPRRASSIHQSNSTQTALSGMHTDNQSAVPSLSIPLNQHHISPPPPPSSQHAPLTNGANSFTLRPDAKQDTAPLLPMSFNTTLLPESTPVTSGSHSIEAVAPQVNGDSQSEPLKVDGKDVVDPITCISEAQEVTKEGNDQIQPGSNQLEHAMEVVSEDIMSEEASFPVSQPHAQNDAAPAFPSAGTFEESSNPSSAPEEGELQEDETCSEEMIEQPSAQVLPTGPTPGYRFPVEVKKLESNFVKTPDGEPSENEQTVPGDDGDAVPVNQLSAQFGSSAESIDRERPRRASPGGPPEPSPPKSSFVGPDEGKVIEDSYAQDSPTSGTQQPYTDVPIGRPPVRSQDEENNYSLDDSTHVSLPSNSKIASSHVQDSSQSVASIGELAPQPVVGSPKGLDAQKPPAVALSHNDELEPVIQASSKSPEPMHDAPFVDTHETLSIKKDVDDHRETFIIEPQSTDQRSVTNVANGTDPHISTLECQHLNFPAPEETRQSPKSTASPSLNPGIAENPRTESPTRLSRRSMSTTNSEAHSEAQDESALSQASEGSEEHLLDSDASTTILGSSDEEMLSSHTPRYLNNRKRIRSKNIIKPPPRMAAVKKGGSLRAERPSGLPAGAMPRFSKPELRAVDKLKSLPAGYQKGDSTRTSSLSDLESEDQARGNSADPMVKKPPGSQMRLTIRSSSPSEIDDIESSEPVVDKQQVPDKLAAVNLPSAVAESQVPGDFQPTAQEQSLVTEKSKATQSSDASAGTGLDPPKNSSLESPAEVSATHSAKAAPKRISLKDYRSRKFSETVVITPLANPLIHFTTSRPPTSTTVTEESHKKQPPPPIIPVLPPLLPPTSQSQPLLPLSPRKLELVASVLKKEEKDRAPLSHEGETDSKKPKHEDQIPTMLPGSSSLSIEASHQLPQGREAPADELDLKLSPNPTALGSSGKIPSTNIVQHESEPRHANPCPQSCEDAALDSYEDDIDGVAIESMSTQSEGEPDDEVRQQELIGKEQQLERHTLEEPKDNVQIHESVQMLAEAQPAASGENLEQSEEPTEEQVPVATAQDQQDKEVGVASGEAQRQQQEQVGVELPQDSGLDKSKKSNASDEAEPPFVDGADRASTQAAIMTVANEGPDQMEVVDEAEHCPQTNTVAVEDRLPTRSDQLPSSRPERADSPAVTTIPSVPREEDAGISSTIVQQAAPAPAPKPRLSLADYRRRNVRPSVSEERHPSQSMSPSLPDLELSRANPPLSSVCSQSLRQNPIANSQPSQQEPKKTHEDAPIPPAAANQARHPLPSSPRPITSPSQQPEHKTKLEDVEPPEVSATLNISSESRSTDATMYFPPISPSILMGMESPRSPELKSPPLPPGSPSEETSLGRETNVAASCSPWQKSPSRTPLESTPVTSTSSLKGDLKPPIVTNQPTHPRVASDLAKLSDTEDPFLGQTAPPAVDSRSVLPLPVVQPPSPPKCEASCASSAQTSNLPPHNTLDHPKTSPSVLVPSLPVPITSHSHVHQHLKPASVAVSGPTPIEVVNPLNCRVQQSPSKTKFPSAHGDQPIPSAPSSRLITAPSTSQRSPTIPLSPLAYKPRTSVSPSSPAPTGLPEIKSSPRGRSNLPPALNRAPSTSRTLRAPPNHNNTTRASWPPESAAGPCQTEPQHINQGPPVAMPFSDMPINPSLPPPPTHAAGSSRTSTYHHYSSSHRGGRFPPMRNFSGHRATTTPITGTSGPGPPGSFRQSQSVNNEGVERARYDGILRGPVPHHASHYPARGRAKVRGGAHPSSSYWSSDNNAGSGGHGGNSSSSGRGLGGPPRNDR